MSAPIDKLYVTLCADGNALAHLVHGTEQDAERVARALDMPPGWRCGPHRMAVFVMVDARGRRAYAQRREGEPQCETTGCTNRVRHVEHWYARKRSWCDACVPMSGHYEHCPDPCERLVVEAFEEGLEPPER